MFDQVVAGIDPGTAATGVAVLAPRRGKAPAVLAAATFRTASGLAEPRRLQMIHEAVRDLLTRHEVQALAIERLMWGRNVGSAMGVARASGVVLLAAAEAGIPVREYAPLEVKMAVTGDGSARKEDVRRALERFHGLKDVPAEPDAADAVAVALCDLHRSRVPQEVRA